MYPVQARECLYRLDVAQRLVHIHGVEQLVVVTCLKLVGHDQEAIAVGVECLFYLRRGKLVELCLVVALATIFFRARKGNDCLVGTVALGQQLLDGKEVIDGTLYTIAYHHAPCLTAYLVAHAPVEVFHHDACLLLYRFGTALHPCTELLGGLVLVKHGVCLGILQYLVEAVVSGVILRNVKNKPFLYGLFHAVEVEGTMPFLSIRLDVFVAKHL